jgi:thiamine-phosphate pyrophosphorylase
MDRLFHDGLRVRAARLAAAARALKEASGAIAPFCLAFMTDRRRLAAPEPILRALPAGSAVLYRDYDDPRREAVARRYQAICRARGVLFLVAGDAALAARIGADGVHWPARALLPSQAGGRGAGGEGKSTDVRRRLTPPHPALSRKRERVKGVITAAAHTADDLVRAASLGAHLAVLSPVFPTQSHPEAEPLGVERFTALAAASPLPVLALGGVDEWNAGTLAGRNVAGLAAIGAFVL